jgi:hypothetical protein
MITITFPDCDTARKALGFFLGRCSGRVLRSGKCVVPNAALQALKKQEIPFVVEGKATYAERVFPMQR